MNTTTPPSRRPLRRLAWTGRTLTTLVVAFLLVDAIAKLFKPQPVLEGTLELGYPEASIVPLGIVLLACTILHAVPRTTVLGAILLTGYLGGAVATHVRVGNPWPSHTLFPVYFGVAMWLGLWLRRPEYRSLLASRR